MPPAVILGFDLLKLSAMLAAAGAIGIAAGRAPLRLCSSRRAGPDDRGVAFLLGFAAVGMAITGLTFAGLLYPAPVALLVAAAAGAAGRRVGAPGPGRTAWRGLGGHRWLLL